MVATGSAAPDPERAKHLVDAAATTLAAVAASRGAPRPSGIVVERLGPTGAAPVVRGPRKAFALVAAVVVFSLWCSALVLASSLRRRVEARAAGLRLA